MPTRLSYVIKYVADMDKAVAFYRDSLDLPLKFASPGWSEFLTGETTLALHIASDRNPAGSTEVGLSVDDLAAFHAEKTAAGVVFPEPPRQEHGVSLASLLDSEGARVGVSG
ncbi:VOC family protein [Phenylobacterium aquaticum]|uniref:VOC family protein n=1 Tax=Phenylobacterium aquaticum TaxID=1763816 RepID=UPI0026F2116F|nr:VOC family protein [Phenylobacterium aquaticum]